MGSRASSVGWIHIYALHDGGIFLVSKFVFEPNGMLEPQLKWDATYVDTERDVSGHSFGLVKGRKYLFIFFKIKYG